MATTLRDVAAEAGVAINTTRKVLSDDPTVRPYIRQRVLAAARKLRYRPNLLARALRTRELNLVPITVPHVAMRLAGDPGQGEHVEKAEPTRSGQLLNSRKGG